MPELVFNLFASCIPVKGKNRSIICDVYRGRFRYIPQALFYILTKLKGRTIAEVKSTFMNKHDEIIDDYFKYLEENEFIFYCMKEELKMFPKLDLTFEFPSEITNCIIDIDESSDFDIASVFSQLAALHCRYLQLRFFSDVSIPAIISLCKPALQYGFNSIHLIVPFNTGMNKDSIAALYESLPVSQLDFYNVPAKEIPKWEKAAARLPFQFLPTAVLNEKHCGKTESSHFSINLYTFGEAQKFNSCLNKKLCIDAKGRIKNCPSMPVSYGDVRNVLLKDVLENSNFKTIWNIKKDDISVCSDCEFRYICTDCRAYLENPKDLYSKPLKCGYDPYTGTWQEWSSHPLKQEAIRYYEMEELVTTNTGKL